MEMFVALGTFITVTCVVYGLMYRGQQDDAMGNRLGGLRYAKPGRESLPDLEASFSSRVLRPLAATVTRRVNGILPSSISDRLEDAITRSGLTITPGKFILICGITAGAVPMLTLLFLVTSGAGSKQLLGMYGAVQGMGILGPRMYLQGKIKKRKKLIWKALPDAFDLITASVEAGLGIDAAFSRVVDKVEGPFADELTRTMREITMGRSRREAFLEMADRTGVEELRSLINAVVQAETMGISIGGVIRVQTGVMRVKRKQKAEEQAFKAPVKMVFPLVLFIFPTIMIVIGGPAIIQMKSAL